MVLRNQAAASAGRLCRLGAALVAGGVAGALTCVPVAAQSNTTFTADELARLAAGTLVTRPMKVERNGLHLTGGSSWRVIDASPDMVWSALHDFARYPKMMPAVIEARQVADRGDERNVYIHNGHWPIFASYYLLLRSDPRARTIAFRLDADHPHSVNDCWGFARVVPYAGDRTLVAFGALADLGHGILSAVGASIFQKTVLEVPSTLKKFLESGGRDLYRDSASRAVR